MRRQSTQRVLCRYRDDALHSVQQNTHLLLQPDYTRPFLLQQPGVLPLRIRRVILEVRIRFKGIEGIRKVVGVEVLKDRLLASGRAVGLEEASASELLKSRTGPRFAGLRA